MDRVYENSNLYVMVNLVRSAAQRRTSRWQDRLGSGLPDLPRHGGSCR